MGRLSHPFCVVSSTLSLRLEVLLADILEVFRHAHAERHVRFVQALRSSDDTADCSAVLDDDLIHIGDETLINLARERQPVEAILNLVREGAVALDLVLDLLGLTAKRSNDILEYTDFVERERDLDFHDIVLL